MTDQATVQSADPVVRGPATEEQLASLFATELTGEQPTGQAETEQGEEAQAASGENPDDVEGVDAQAEQSDAEYVEVPKLEGEGMERITREELKARMLMHADYTRKTQAVAEERKAIQAEREKVMATISKHADEMGYRLTVLGQTIQSIEQQVNWDALRELDPGAYIKAKEEQQKRLQTFEEGRKQYEQAQKMVKGQRVAQNTQRLVEAMPILLDPKAAKEFAETLANESQANYGLTAQDLDAIDDHRLILALKDANELRRLRAKSADTKAAVAKAPQLAKPGAPRQGNPEALRTHKVITRARTEGSPEALEAAFGALFKK
jgi:hypothetical protein